MENSESMKQREILKKFYVYSKINKIMHRFFAKIMETSAGGVFKGFNKWRTLPEI